MSLFLLKEFEHASKNFIVAFLDFSRRNVGFFTPKSHSPTKCAKDKSLS